MSSGKVSVFYYDRDSASRADPHKRRKANEEALFGPYNGMVELTKPDWAKDFLGQKGALTVVSEGQFEAYLVHALADGADDMIDSLLLSASERRFPVSIGIIGYQSAVSLRIEQIKSDAAGLGVECKAYCLPSEANGYLNGKAHTEQSRVALKQMLEL